MTIDKTTDSTTLKLHNAYASEPVKTRKQVLIKTYESYYDSN